MERKVRRWEDIMIDAVISGLIFTIGIVALANFPQMSEQEKLAERKRFETQLYEVRQSWERVREQHPRIYELIEKQKQAVSDMYNPEKTFFPYLR